MKTLAILVLILSAAYISEAGKGRKNKPQEAAVEEVAPEVEVEVEEEEPEWGAILAQIRTKLEHHGEDVRAKVEDIIEKHNLDELVANAAAKAEGAAAKARAKGIEAFQEIDAALEEHGVDIHEMLADAKESITSAITSAKKYAKGYFESLKNWWNTD